MGNFNREGDKGGFRSGGRNGQRDGGRPSFQKKSWGGDSGNKEAMKHQATCSECGKRCEVPFRPVNGKPVYCNDCFSTKRGVSPAGNDRMPAKSHYENRENRGGEGNDGVRRQLAEVNMKLDRLIKTMEAFTGTSVKPVVAEAPKKEEKKSVNVAELKKVLTKATEKEAKPALKKVLPAVKQTGAKKSAVTKKKK